MIEVVDAIRELKETKLQIGHDWEASRPTEVGRIVVVCWKCIEPGHVQARCGNINRETYLGEATHVASDCDVTESNITVTRVLGAVNGMPCRISNLHGVCSNHYQSVSPRKNRKPAPYP